MFTRTILLIAYLSVPLAPPLATTAAPSDEEKGANRLPDGYTPWVGVRKKRPGQPGMEGVGRSGDGRAGAPRRCGGALVDIFEGDEEMCLAPVGDGDGGRPPVAPVTPGILLWRAMENLRLPVPEVRTAPPRDANGLVNMPEWFWVASGQRDPMSRRAQVGDVWAEVTATPSRLTIKPDAELPAKACAGLGRPFKFGSGPDVQRTGCSYTFTRPSVGLPNSAYPVRATVTWTASWRGSGGEGGALAPLDRTASFPLRIAEIQSVTTGR